jgi:hypothetical protein
MALSSMHLPLRNSIQGSFSMNRTFTAATTLRMAAAAVVTLIALPAGAVTITDPVGDFVPACSGTHSGDIDVVSASVAFDGTAFHFSATLDGAIGTLSTSLYVIGVNRGSPTSNFAAPPINLLGVVFDTVVTMTGTEVTGGRDLITNTALVLPMGAVHIAGDSFELDIPLSLLLELLLLNEEAVFLGQINIAKDASPPFLSESFTS